MILAPVILWYGSHKSPICVTLSVSSIILIRDSMILRLNLDLVLTCLMWLVGEFCCTHHTGASVCTCLTEYLYKRLRYWSHEPWKQFSLLFNQLVRGLWKPPFLRRLQLWKMLALRTPWPRSLCVEVNPRFRSLVWLGHLVILASFTPTLPLPKGTKAIDSCLASVNESDSDCFWLPKTTTLFDIR